VEDEETSETSETGDGDMIMMIKTEGGVEAQDREMQNMENWNEDAETETKTETETEGGHQDPSFGALALRFGSYLQ
jgi:hypothetical protein